jgi:hypothetical protein
LDVPTDTTPEDTGGAGSSTDLRQSAVKRQADENERPTRRVRFEDPHGEKRAGEDINQPTRRVKVVEPQGEKRKEMETDFEENIRSLQTQAKNMGLIAKDALDIRGWKTSNANKEQMTKKIIEEKPMIIIGGMSGSSFSRLRNLKKVSDTSEKTDKEYLQGVVGHYKTQIGEGRLFLHGDPVGSGAWRTSEMQALRKTPGIRSVEIDLCMFANGKDMPNKGPMRFITNSTIIERDLKRKCDRLHDHRG